LRLLSQQQAPSAAGTVHRGAAFALPTPTTDSLVREDTPPSSPRRPLVNFELEEKQL